MSDVSAILSRLVALDNNPFHTGSIPSPIGIDELRYMTIDAELDVGNMIYM